MGTPIHLAFGVFVCWCIPRCRPELVGPPGMSPTSQAKGRHYRQDRHRRLPPLFSFVGSTGTGSEISGLGKMMKWIYGFSDKPWSHDLFLGSREIWSVWFGCFGLFNASNCPNCNVLRVRFFFWKKKFTQPDMNEAGQFLDNFSNLSPTWQGNITLKMDLFILTVHCCFQAQPNAVLLLDYPYSCDMSIICLRHAYYIPIIRLYRPLFLLVRSIFCWIHKPRNLWKISTFYPSNQVNSCYPLVNVYIANWKDPPCFFWVNPLFHYKFMAIFY